MTMFCAVIVTMLLAVGPTPGVGAVSVPFKMTYSTVYRIRSRSFLPSGLFYIINGVSDIQCYARCLLSTRCLSVNYKRAKQKCEMSNMSVNIASPSTPINLIENDEYHYMDKKDIPAGLIGRCAGSSDQEENCRIPVPRCSLGDKVDRIIEEKGDEFFAHSSCLADGETEICDAKEETWRPHRRNCAGLHWKDPSPVFVPGVDTFVERPYDGAESREHAYKGDGCHAQHKCRNLTGGDPTSYCPVSRCDGHYSWTTATLSCSEYDCFDTVSLRYEGRVSCTVGGIQCQRWDTDTPHRRGGHVVAAHVNMDVSNNWCMTTTEALPWCYTTDPYIRWDFCPVDGCP